MTHPINGKCQRRSRTPVGCDLHQRRKTHRHTHTHTYVHMYVHTHGHTCTVNGRKVTGTPSIGETPRVSRESLDTVYGSKRSWVGLWSYGPVWCPSRLPHVESMTIPTPPPSRGPFSLLLRLKSFILFYFINLKISKIKIEGV